MKLHANLTILCTSAFCTSISSIRIKISVYEEIKAAQKLPKKVPCKNGQIKTF